MGSTLVYIGLLLITFVQLAVASSIGGQSLEIIGWILVGVGAALALINK